MHMKRVFFIIVAFGALGGFLFWFFSKSVPSSPLVLRVADPKAVGWAPFYVALENDLFIKQGIDVQVIPVQTGDESLKALLSNSVDISLAGLIPYAFVALEDSQLKVFSFSSYAHDNQIVARKTAHIQKPLDLKGKKIGYAKTTASDIGLEYFARQHGLAISEFVLVPLKPLAMPAALTSHEVDAISIWEPHITNTVKALGDDGFVFNDASSTYTWHAALVARDSFITQNRDLLRRFVGVWREAQFLMETDSTNALKAISSHARLSEAALKEVLDKFDYQDTLSTDLISILEEDLLWANARREKISETLPVSPRQFFDIWTD